MYRGFQLKKTPNCRCTVFFPPAQRIRPRSHVSPQFGAGADATFVPASALQLSTFRPLFSHLSERRRLPLNLNNEDIRARVEFFFLPTETADVTPLSSRTPAPRRATQSRPVPWYIFLRVPRVARGLSVGQLAVIAEVEAGHDPHAVGTNGSATPLARRQVGGELVAQRAFSEPPQRIFVFGLCLQFVRLYTTGWTSDQQRTRQTEHHKQLGSNASSCKGGVKHGARTHNSTTSGANAAALWSRSHVGSIPWITVCFCGLGCRTVLWFQVRVLRAACRWQSLETTVAVVLLSLVDNSEALDLLERVLRLGVLGLVSWTFLARDFVGSGRDARGQPDSRHSR